MHEMMTRRAQFSPTTADDDARTVVVSWGAGAPVRRRMAGAAVVEELDMSADAVDLSQLKNGAKLLDSHRAESVMNVLGTVEDAWLENGEGFARVRFSKRPDVEPIWQDVRSGVLTGVSVGYVVHKWAERNENGTRIQRAVRWTPIEVSLVATPADGSARVRNNMWKETDMDEHAEQSAQAQETRGTETGGAETRAAENVEKRERRVDPEATRMAEIDAAYDAAVRVAGDEIATRLRDSAKALGQSAAAYRDAVWQAMVESHRTVSRPQPRPTVGVGQSNDDPAVVRERIATALAARIYPAVAERAGDTGWQKYRDAATRPSLILAEMAAARGERDAWRNRTQLFERAFHTTSDFPELLAAAANKALDAMYAAATPTYRAVFARRSFNDFRPHRFVTMGDWPALKKLGEGGEIELGTVAEKRETVAAGTFARSITLTRQLLENDDLGAFSDFTAMIGTSVATFEDAAAFGLMGENNGDGPTLAEGNARVFTTGRGNKAATGTAINVASLAAARAAVMQQTTLGGLPIAIGNQMILLVGPQKELEARQLTATINPSQTSSVNPYAGFIETVVSPFITGNRWYLFATATRPYVYGFVGGREAPQVRTYGQMPGFDGVRIDVVHDFGVGAIDWRGAYFNPGA